MSFCARVFWTEYLFCRQALYELPTALFTALTSDALGGRQECSDGRTEGLTRFPDWGRSSLRSSSCGPFIFRSSCFILAIIG
jgi:hypothetical protein